MRLDDLQRVHRTWVQRNFGDQPAHRSILGTLEELGELAHAHLKEEQGIRGDAAMHVAEARDAVGDVIIFLTGYCDARGWDIQTLRHRRAPHDLHPSVPHHHIFQAARALSELAELSSITRRTAVGRRLADARGRGAVTRTLAALDAYCDQRGWKLEDVIGEAWAVVERRDWKSAPRTGRPEGPAAA